MAYVYSETRKPKVAVIGTGALGLAISGELARSCCEVYVYDKNEDNLQQVHHRLQGQRAQLIEDNLLAADEAFSVVVESHLSCAVMEADFVIEAIVEDLTIKNTLMKNLSMMCSDDAVICSNTLTLNLDDVFNGINNPQRTLGMRFLLPVYFIPLVELTSHGTTSPATTDKVKELLRFIKKESFGRGSDGPPRKLMVHEARAMQHKTAGRSLSADANISHVHDAVARGSHDAIHGHFYHKLQ